MTFCRRRFLATSAALSVFAPTLSLAQADNVLRVGVHFGRDNAILQEREKIKKLTIQKRRLQHQK